MYKIIGGDQREYGPVSAEDVRQWIAEGRLNGRSRAKAEGESQWRALAEFPEFRSALEANEAPPPPVSGQTPPPINTELWTTEILAREPYVPVGSCLTRSWELLKKNFRLLFTASLVIWGIGVVQIVPVLGLAYTALCGVFYGGLCLVFLKRIRGEPAEPREVFSGFNIAFGQLVLVGLIVVLVTNLGFFCLCFIPGVYLFVAWIFAVPLVIDKRLEFWSAMELSRKVVTRVWVPVFLLLSIALLPVILLKLATFVSAITQVASVTADAIRATPHDAGRIMERVLRMNAETLSLGIFARAVLLFNLPLAVGAVMYAYEGLFGARPGSTS